MVDVKFSALPAAPQALADADIVAIVQSVAAVPTSVRSTLSAERTYHNTVVANRAWGGFDLTGLGDVKSTNANGFQLTNAASSATVPTVLYDRAATTSGLGGTGTALSLITAGVEALTVDASQNVTIPTGDLTVTAGDIVTTDGDITINSVAGTADIFFTSNAGANTGSFQFDGSGNMIFRQAQATMYFDYHGDCNFRDANAGFKTVGSFGANRMNLGTDGDIDTNIYIYSDTVGKYVRILSGGSESQLRAEGAQGWALYTNSVAALTISSAQDVTIDAGDLTVTAGGVIAGNADGFQLLAGAAGGTTPTLIPRRSVPTYGIGGTATMLTIVAGGAEVVRFTSGLTNHWQDLAVGSSKLFVDYSTTRVGINTNTPDTALHVNSSTGAKFSTSATDGFTFNQLSAKIWGWSALAAAHVWLLQNTQLVVNAAAAAGSDFLEVTGGASILTGDLTVTAGKATIGATAEIAAGTASATVPVFLPQSGATTTGIGGTSGEVSIIVGGIERIEVDATGTIRINPPVGLANKLLFKSNSGANQGSFELDNSGNMVLRQDQGSMFVDYHGDLYWRDTNAGSAQTLRCQAGKVSIKPAGTAPIATSVLQLHGAAATAAPVLLIEQLDDDDAFVNYVGTTAASAAKSISSWTAGNSIQGFTRDEVNGAVVWRPYYDAPTS